MLKRSWIISLVFGLTVSLGQAQEQAEDPNGTAANQQDPAQTFPVPLPVDIVEDQAAAETRQRKEEEARNREIRDLAAQEGMNAATQSIERATRDMRDYALYSTILVGLGTFMLGVTLWLTRQANRAAQKAIDVTQRLGQSQIRAYVSIEEDTFGPLSDDSVGMKPYRKVWIKNYGASPALNMRQSIELIVEDSQLEIVDGVKDGLLTDPSWPRVDLPPQEKIATHAVSKAAVDAAVLSEAYAVPQKKAFFAVGKIFYDDVFGFSHTTEFCLKLVAEGKGIEGDIFLQWERTNGGNVAD